MRAVIMFVLSALGFVSHILISPEIAIFGAKIDFIMITVIMLAMLSKKWYPPVFCALYSGIAVDLTTQGGTFINTGIYLFFAVICVVLFALFKQKGFAVSALATFIFIAAKHFMYVFLLYLLRLSEAVSLTTFFHGIPSAIYSAVAALPIFYLYKISLNFMQENIDSKRRFIGNNGTFKARR